MVDTAENPADTDSSVERRDELSLREQLIIPAQPHVAWFLLTEQLELLDQMPGLVEAEMTRLLGGENSVQKYCRFDRGARPETAVSPDEL